MPPETKSPAKGKREDYKDRHQVERVELLWPHEEPLNPEADIADIMVHMKDGTRFRGTVTTLQFIQETMERAARESAEAGEGSQAEGDYWFGDAIIMRRIDESKLRTIVEDLIDSFQFEKAFQRAEAATMA